VVQQGRPRWRRSGATGWVLAGGVILFWDATAPETLSEAFRRSLQTRRGRAVSVLLWGYLTAHLFQVIPPRADPLEAACTWRRRFRLTS
jgi:hypothetical protein